MAAEKFNGMSDVEDFITQFDAISVIKDWNEEKKRVAIAAYLDGPALSWFKANFAALTTYDLVKQKIREQFLSQIDYTQAFYYRRQGPTETLIEFYYDLDRLAMKAKISEDEKFVRHFIRSVIEKYQALLACKIFSSKDELKKTLFQMEQIFNSNVSKNTQGVQLPVGWANENVHYWHAQGDRSSASGPENTPQSRYGTPQTPVTAVAPRDAQQGTSFTPRGRYNLRPRQWQQRVPRGAQASNRQQPQSAQASASASNVQSRQGHRGASNINMLVQDPTYEGRQEEELQHAAGISSIKQERFPDICSVYGRNVDTLVPIELQGTIVNAMVDTGAVVSVISKSLADDLQLKYNEYLCTPLRAAGGTTIHTYGTIIVSFLLDSAYFKASLIVIQDDSKMILLGQNFLTSNGAVIDFHRQTLTLKNEFHVKFLGTNLKSKRKRQENEFDNKEVNSEEFSLLTVECQARENDFSGGSRALIFSATGTESIVKSESKENEPSASDERVPKVREKVGQSSSDEKSERNLVQTVTFDQAGIVETGEQKQRVKGTGSAYKKGGGAMRGRAPRWRCVFACVCALLAAAGIAISLTWGRVFDSVLARQVALTPSSRAFREWVAPSVPLFMDVYLFNWTNSERFPEEKPNLVQLGPYRFKERRHHVNVTWHRHNDSLAYRTKRTWHFHHSSNGSLSDNITILNIIAASAVHRARDWSFIEQKTLSMALAMFGQHMAVSKLARELLFEGYEDAILDVAKSLPASTTGGAPPVDKFGLFYERNNSINTDGYMEVTTGLRSGTLPGQVLRWNHEDHLPFYSGECSKLSGSAGEFMPRNLTEQSTLSVFVPDLCRVLRLTHQRSGLLSGLPYHRYAFTPESFDNSSSSHQNSCFCNGECVWGGVMNVSACRFGSPSFISLPHFLHGDPALGAAVTGLQPDEEKHSFFFSVEPKLGVPLEVGGRFQLNMYIEPTPHIALYENVPKMLFPIMWVDQNVRTDESIISDLRYARAILDWGATVCACAALLLMVLVAMATCYSRKHKYSPPLDIGLMIEKPKDEAEIKLNPM